MSHSSPSLNFEGSSCCSAHGLDLMAHSEGSLCMPRNSLVNAGQRITRKLEGVLEEIGLERERRIGDK